MTARTPRLAVALALLAAGPASAAADLAVSSAPIAGRPIPLEFSFGAPRHPGPRDRASVGAGGGLAEGLPLEMGYWGGAGAVVGSVAGPLGAAVGGAAGGLLGALISLFVTPPVRPGRG